ncbi:MAG: hypothetical protein A2Z83_05305 [Omnitrophica bacterium GWA2_52_8]|nr:MAG: hypothetical protein A2Z83_05305 [Omnitrophica bacterium GWA2_52_8]
MTLFFDGFIFFLGAVFGSFLNVCIHRVPKGESVVKPGSRCPECLKPIRWFDNIPVLSFLALRGQCRNCGVKISPRYFLVELSSGGFWLGLWKLYGFSGFSAAGVILFSILLVVSATDFETGFIPDKLTFPGMAAGFLLSALFPALQGESLWYRGELKSLLGFVAGGGILLAIGFFGNWIFKKESMGGGDIKLIAMLGAFLGVEKVLLVFLFAPLAAIPFALYMKFARKAETIPFGPFLALAGALLFVYGDWIGKTLFYF